MTKTAVYRMYDCDGSLLYVGASAAPFRRAYQHALRSEWADEVERVEVTWLPSRSAALQCERETIESENPSHNRRFNGSEDTRTRGPKPKVRGSGVDNSQLVKRINKFLQETNETRTSFGARVANDYSFVQRIEAGTDLRASTLAKIEDAISEAAQ